MISYKRRKLLLFYIPFIAIFLLLSIPLISYFGWAIFYVAILNIFPFTVLVIPAMLKSEEDYKVKPLLSGGGMKTVKMFFALLSLIFLMFYMGYLLILGQLYCFFYGLLPFFLISIIILGFISTKNLKKGIKEKKKLGLIIPLVTIISSLIPLTLLGLSSNEPSITSLLLKLVLSLFCVLMWLIYLIKHKFFTGPAFEIDEGKDLIFAVFVVVYVLIWPILTKFWAYLVIGLIELEGIYLFG